MFRNREFEDQNLEMERRFLQQIDEEKSRHQEALNKIDTLHQEEKETLLTRFVKTFNKLETLRIFRRNK